jgi:hypothetical protein
MFIAPRSLERTSPLGSSNATSERRKVFQPLLGYKHLVPTGRRVTSLVPDNPYPRNSVTTVAAVAFNLTPDLATRKFC